MRIYLALSSIFLLLCGVPVLGYTETAPVTHRLYPYLSNPEEHPDYARRAVKPPSWKTFDNQTQFVTLRGFGVTADKRIEGYAEELEKYTKTYDLGRVIWPAYSIVFAKNLQELADEIKRRDLFLFDIWGYVPGSGPGGDWQQYRPTAENLSILENTLGDHWLGMDVGEQDGRYIGGYGEQVFPISNNRFDQYLNFQRHFSRMGDDLGNRLATLVSLNFGHYLLKEGTYTTIGAETAQALPNSQVYYAFIRGAGKQYGVPWFGNASIFNRWGYKTYGSTGPDHSPTKGTSLNLLKRLMYTHILYNCVFVGFENGWFEGEELSAIGRIQQNAQKWVRTYGQPGVMMTPVALLFDYYSGWTFPRHLYTSQAYRVWGNIPYDAGDYYADGVLDMIYPDYQNASYYHDESGFMTPTPYGDLADCLLSDSAPELLRQYSLLVAVSTLSGGRELKEKLEAYVNAGGRLVITAGNIARFSEGICGISAESMETSVPAGAEITLDNTTVTEANSFRWNTLHYPDTAAVIASFHEKAAAVKMPYGSGEITVLASAFGVSENPVGAVEKVDAPDSPLAKPFPLLHYVRALLDKALKEQALFEAGEGLSVVTCRKEAGVYTIGVCNNQLEAKPFTLISHCGPIESVTELTMDTSEKGAVGYLPEGYENAAIGSSDKALIAGGDVRIFSVKVREESVVEIPHETPAPAPKGRILPLRGERTIQESILARPTFFAHYDGVCIDWRYLYNREERALKKESEWLKRQGVRIYVDLTSGINLYPDLRLIDNDSAEYAASMAVLEDVLKKMPALDAHHLILSPNRTPENNFTYEQTMEAFAQSLKKISADAAKVSVAVYLRVCDKLNGNMEANYKLLESAGFPDNLWLAPSIALLEEQGREPDSVDAPLRGKIGLWLAAAPQMDIRDKAWSINGPLYTAKEPQKVYEWLGITPEKPVVFDAVYSDADMEYRDARLLEEIDY